MIDYNLALIKIGQRLVSAIVCYFLAKKQNRNKAIAVALGMAIGVFALIYYLIMAAKYMGIVLVNGPYSGKSGQLAALLISIDSSSLAVTNW